MGRLTSGCTAGELPSSQSRPVPSHRHDPPHTRRAAMSQSSTLYIGMDVHQASMAVAYVPQEHDAEVISLGPIGTRQGEIDHLVRPLQAKAKPLVFVSEAGPLGRLALPLSHAKRPCLRGRRALTPAPT